MDNFLIKIAKLGMVLLVDLLLLITYRFWFTVFATPLAFLSRANLDNAGGGLALAFGTAFLAVISVVSLSGIVLAKWIHDTGGVKLIYALLIIILQIFLLVFLSGHNASGI